MTTDPTARELLEAAFHEAKRGNAGIVWVDDIERTPSGAELLRRAAEPRVADCAGCGRQECPCNVPTPPDLRVTKGPGTFGPDATWTIRTEPDRTAALVGSLETLLDYARCEGWCDGGVVECGCGAVDARVVARSLLAATPEPAPVAEGYIPSQDLRPLGECRGCGRDRRHVNACCPDCDCFPVTPPATPSDSTAAE